MSSPQQDNRSNFEPPLTNNHSDKGAQDPGLTHAVRIDTPCKTVRKALSLISAGISPEVQQDVLLALASRGLIEMRTPHDFELSQDRSKSLARAETTLEGHRAKLDAHVERLRELYRQIEELTSKTSGLGRLKSWFSGELSEFKRQLDETRTNSDALEASARRLQSEMNREGQVVDQIRQENDALVREKETYVVVKAAEACVRTTDAGTRFARFMTAYGEQISATPFDAFERGCHNLEGAITGKLSAITEVAGELVARGFYETVAREIAFAASFYQGDKPFVERVMEVSQAVETSRLPFRDFTQAVVWLTLREGEPAALISDLAGLYEVAVSRGLRNGPHTLQLMVSLIGDGTGHPSADERISTLFAISERCEELCRAVAMPEH